MDYFNVYATMKTMFPPGYHDSGFMATHALDRRMMYGIHHGYIWDTLCAQVHELPKSHCGDNR